MGTSKPGKLPNFGSRLICRYPEELRKPRMPDAAFQTGDPGNCTRDQIKRAWLEFGDGVSKLRANLSAMITQNGSNRRDPRPKRAASS